MSALSTLPNSEAPHRSKAAIPNHTRLRVVLPLCVIVALAIACIVVAALTSAHRANDVAIAHEQDLFLNTLTARGNLSQRKLRSVMGPVEDRRTPFDLDQIKMRVGLGFQALIDPDLILVANPADGSVHRFLNRSDIAADWIAAATLELAPTISHLQGRTQAPPDGVAWLGTFNRSGSGSYVEEAAFLQVLKGNLVIVAAVATGATEPDGATSPVVLALQIVDDAMLTQFATRLQLEHLRRIEGEKIPAGDIAYALPDYRGEPVARFAWTPQRPGAAVLNTVIPFIAIAICGFALLMTVMMRYMRRTAAEISAAHKSLHHLAMHDPLSGLPNRMYFSEELETTIRKVHEGGDPAAVFYIDLDHFKDVNDTLGHSIGDALILSVTKRLTGVLRGGDFASRLGGDEFAVITRATDDLGALQSIADRIIQTLCAPYSVESHAIVIGASIGIAFIAQHTADTSTDIMRYADMALYRAKNEGRNRACIYDNVMDADLSRRKQLEFELRSAIENGELDVVYQPVVNASGEKIVGVEALARWLHPERGFISPIEFIPLAEQSGAIFALGEWVLRRACRDGKAWPSLSVAVNVSPVQFRRADFVEIVEQVLSETGFDPNRLELELTESTLIGNLDIAESAMLRLKSLGVRLALDDFGTGYSSLLYLRRFPFDKLKIDRSFVLSIEKTPDAAAIVHAIVSLGRGLGMKVTAEGVENAEQHLFLRAAGVHFMQGYRFGKPCSAAEITKCLATPGAYRKIERDAVAAMAS